MIRFFFLLSGVQVIVDIYETQKVKYLWLGTGEITKRYEH